MADQSTKAFTLKQLMAPKYWPTWFIMGIIYALSFLPWKLQQFFGKQLGLLLYKVNPRRRRICDINFQICFPEMTAPEREALTREHFISSGKGLFETFASWFQPATKYASRAHCDTQHVLDDVLSRGQGCILISGHFSSLDLCGSLVSRHLDVHPIYKKQSNAVFNWVMEHQRKKVYSKMIERTDMREVLKSLKDNKTVWYAVDQDYGREYSVFAPFYGRQCATISYLTRIAKLTNAPVVLYDYGRSKNGYSYRFKEIENYPTKDEIYNATVINQLMEEAIDPKKEQYLWSHRRFKTQVVEGDPSPYDC